VDAISKFILDCGANLEDSRMAVLGGEFAMLILVSGSQETVGRVTAGAEAAGREMGLTVQAKPTRPSGEQAPAEAIPFELEAYSMDHPGIVQRISRYLGERGINVRALETRVSQAPVSGQPLFSLHAVVDVPAQVSVRSLRRDLDELGDQENIDIEVRPARE
jgi:glycine cleavage system transcriptional repressor